MDGWVLSVKARREKFDFCGMCAIRELNAQDLLIIERDDMHFLYPVISK